MGVKTMTWKTKGTALVLVTLIGLLSACSSSKSGDDTTSSTTPVSSASAATVTKDPYEITLAFPIFGAVPKDMAAVEAEINKISKEKINATVKILPISIGAWGQQMSLMASSGEKLDLAFQFGFGGGYATQVATGSILPLDELLNKYGQGVKEAVGSDYMKSAQVGGKIYGAPTVHDYAASIGIFMRKDLIQKHNINTSAIKKLDDLEPVFKAIKDNEPGITPMAAGISTPVDTYLWYDKLGDRYGVLPNFDNGLKVVNLFETKEYADMLTRLNSWYKAGYINKDAATTQSTPDDLMKANKAFAIGFKNRPGLKEEMERTYNKELEYVELVPQAYSTTDMVMNGIWTISKNSGNPERSMMFMNMMYADKTIANLLVWGIEGKHYVKSGDNSIEYPTGVDVKSVGYANQAWITGNEFLTYVMKPVDPDLRNKTKAFNNTALKSKALGFAFNSESVKNEITALNNVLDQYRRGLESGTLNPVDKLPEFNAKLKAAGIEKVIAEKQKQLDAWVAAEKK
jgi:putative aldouronate transport system substrate-binding protein